MRNRWQDWSNLLLGLWVFVSPWVLQHTMTTGAAAAGAVTSAAMWSFYISGIAIAILAAAALLAFQTWEEWVNLALGSWLFVSPWVLGFSTSTLLMWNAVIAGALIVLLAGWGMSPAQGPRQGPAKHA